MPAVDTLLTLLVEDTRNISASMAAAGFSEEEIRGGVELRPAGGIHLSLIHI